MKNIWLLMALAWGLGACVSAPPPPWNGPPLSQPRQQLTVEHLHQADTLALLDMSHFAKPTWALDAAHSLSGTLTFDDSEMVFPLVRTPYDGERLFPAFAIDVISDGGDVILVQQGVIYTQPQSASFWDVIVGAGQVWREAEDGAWSRASFPLTLTDRYMGQVRNCVASFVYTSERISNVYVQCSQETADIDAGQVGDMRVMLQARYTPQAYPNAADVVAAHERHVQQRLPIAPLQHLNGAQALTERFGAFRATNAPTSVGAVLVDGTLYRQSLPTRHGAYPYPHAMRHGVYSVTKSMAGALALLYMAERYGEALMDATIAGYVPELADHPGWQGVTFGHTLNMVTGVEGGEAAEHLLHTLVLARSAAEALGNIATLGDAPTAPGEYFNYASTNLFVLSQALQNYVRRAEGENVHYWDLVREEVLVPIGAERFALLHTVEPEGARGLPVLAYGALPTLDEAAKIARLFAQEGQHNGQQLLHHSTTREALGRTDWVGHSTRRDDRGHAYRHSFWSMSVDTPACRVEASYMLGYGGNYVVFMPNDAVLIRFMDEHDYDVQALVRGLEGVTPSCP